MEGYCVKNMFLKEALDKACSLKAKGINILVEKFDDKGQVIELIVTGKTRKVFQISFEEGAIFLENPEHHGPGGRPVYSTIDDMLSLLFVLANGGPVMGKLMYPGTEEKKFFQVPVVVPT